MASEVTEIGIIRVTLFSGLNSQLFAVFHY